MTTLNPSDLSDLERVALAVLGAGLVPSGVAGDPSFRLDYLTAIALALHRGQPRQTYLDPDGAHAGPAFQHELTGAFDELERKQILAGGPPPPELVLTLDGQPAAHVKREGLANFDQHPKVFDRYLAGRCLDAVLNQREVYRFIMDRYADSSEIWQRVYQQYT